MYLHKNKYNVPVVFVLYFKTLLLSLMLDTAWLGTGLGVWEGARDGSTV